MGRLALIMKTQIRCWNLVNSVVNTYADETAPSGTVQPSRLWAAEECVTGRSPMADGRPVQVLSREPGGSGPRPLDLPALSVGGAADRPAHRQVNRIMR